LALAASPENPSSAQGFRGFFMAKSKPLPISDAVAHFKLDRRAQGFSAGTLRFYSDKLSQFQRWAAGRGVRSVDQLTPALVRAYLVHLQERKLRDSTVHAAFRALRTFSNFLVAEKLVKTSPLANVHAPKLARRILPAFTSDDVARLLAAAPDARARALVLFLLDTGMRAAECINLNGGDIDLKAGTVRVREGKGRKDRTVYVGPSTRQALLAYFGQEGWPEDGGAVWRSERTGERLTDSGLRQVFQALGAAAGVKHCHPHTFRRTFALESLRGGMNIYALAQLMGHSDIHTLKQYLPLVEDDLQTAHDKASPVDRLLK
jgi:site-specific recombinase XerD